MKKYFTKKSFKIINVFIFLLIIEFSGCTSLKGEKKLTPFTRWSKPIDSAFVGKLVTNDKESGFFGYSVSLSSDGATALIGALRGTGHKSGAAYIFKRNNDIWIKEAKLIAADDNQKVNFFGYSVSLSSNGTIALIGAFGDTDKGQGAAYIFSKNESGWSQEAKLTAAGAEKDNHFGYSVSISSEGTTALIGANGDSKSGPASGAAYIFSKSGSGWSQEAKLTAVDAEKYDLFGSSVSLSADGVTALIGANGNNEKEQSAGAAYIFSKNESGWSQEAKLTAGDAGKNALFGASVSLSDQGTTALVGANGDSEKGRESGAAYIFSKNESGWSQEAKLTAVDEEKEDQFGISVSLAADGSAALIGAFAADKYKGDAYIFMRKKNIWSQREKLAAEDAGDEDQFGISVSLSSKSSTLLIGAFSADSYKGDAYNFDVFFK